MFFIRLKEGKQAVKFQAERLSLRHERWGNARGSVEEAHGVVDRVTDRVTDRVAHGIHGLSDESPIEKHGEFANALWVISVEALKSKYSKFSIFN